MSKDKFLRQTIINQNRRKNKSYTSIMKIFELLKKGENVYCSTINREWFKQRFKDITGSDVNMIVEGNNTNIYKLKLNEKKKK